MTSETINRIRDRLDQLARKLMREDREADAAIASVGASCIVELSPRDSFVGDAETERALAADDNGRPAGFHKGPAALHKHTYDDRGLCTQVVRNAAGDVLSSVCGEARKRKPRVARQPSLPVLE